MSLKSKIESLLFISNYPLQLKRLVELTDEKIENIKAAVDELFKEYQERQGSGIVITRIDDKVQMATSPENAKTVKQFVKDETTGELTRASLETLTIIAYRGPVTRAEIEQIRGVNCSIILRNLLLRGLIEEETDKKKMETRYRVSFDFLRFLGIAETNLLPDFEKLNNSEKLQKILEQNLQEDGSVR